MLLTPPEAAAALRVSVRMVYALMASGAIQATTIGRAKRIDDLELSRYIESCRSTSTRKMDRLRGVQIDPDAPSNIIGGPRND